MACLSLAFWYEVFVYVVILVAVCALLKLVVMALGGTAGPFWPPQFMPPEGSAKTLSGFLAAALNIIIWVAIMLFILWLVFALLSCLLGGPIWSPRFR